MRSSREIINLYINLLFKNGKKQRAEGVMLDILSNIKKLKNLNYYKFLNQVVENNRPYVGLITKRVGGASYKIPVNLTIQREYYLAARWVIDLTYVRKSKNKKLLLKQELLQAYKNEGKAVRKKLYLYSLAQKNRGYIKYL